MFAAGGMGLPPYRYGAYRRAYRRSQQTALRRSFRYLGARRTGLVYLPAPIYLAYGNSRALPLLLLPNNHRERTAT